MSQTIELKDEVFTKLKKTADRNGVTPEVWIELKIKESSNDEEQKPTVNNTDEERKELDEFHQRTEEKFDEIMSEKKKKAWGNFIGAGDSSKSSVEKAEDKNLQLAKRVDKVFGEVVTEKMKRIGLKIQK